MPNFLSIDGVERVNLDLIQHISVVEGLAVVFYYRMLDSGIAFVNKAAKMELKNQQGGLHRATSDISVIKREAAPGRFIKMIALSDETFNYFMGEIDRVCSQFEICRSRV